MHRGEHRGSWQLRAGLFSVAAAATGTMLGGAVGAIGAQLAASERAALGAGLALVGVIIAVFQGFGRSLAPLQCDRLTPKRWARESAIRWAIKNGASLGSGLFTKIGFWAWYVIPTGAFLSGSALRGAVIYGAYGVSRGLAVWGIIAVARWREIDTPEWLIQHSEAAKTAATGLLAAVATFALVSVGL